MTYAGGASSKGFARKCFGLEASLKETILPATPSQNSSNPEASQSGLLEAAVGLHMRFPSVIFPSG